MIRVRAHILALIAGAGMLAGAGPARAQSGPPRNGAAGTGVPATNARSASGDSLRTDTRVPSSDTARSARLRTVVVRAESIVTRAAAAAQPTSILQRATIESAHARDASDAVALAPGAFVRQYGGLGGLRTLSLRGTSSQQTVILIDGVRYQSSAAGGVDLGSIPASVLRRVEVVRGGDAARFGANALGGAVNLVIDPAGAPGGASARLDAGSFGERSATLAASGGTDEHAFNGSLTLTGFDGDYPFAWSEYGERSTVRRDNADLSSLFGRAAWSHRIDDDWRVGVSAVAFDSERGVPGAIVQGHREQLRARLAERELFGVARAALLLPDWHAVAAVSTRLNRLDYRDPDATTGGPLGIDNRYDRFETSLLLRASHALAHDGIAELASELTYARLGGASLDPAAGGEVDRLQWGASIAASRSFDSLVPSTDLLVESALRLELFSDLPSALMPSFGIVARPMRGPVRLRLHGSINYRVPTFTEQYYLNYGNTDLRPEFSQSLDIGATCELGGTLLAEAGLFLIDTRDQIVSVPRSPVVWTAMNVARTRSRGLELGLSGTLLDGLLALNASYTRMRAEDRTPGETGTRLLVYSPEELLSALVEVRGDWLAAGVVAQRTSHRHTLPTNTPESALPAYALLGAHLRAHGTIGALEISARLEVSNLLDEQYQVVRNYPMPGRALRLGLEVGYAVR